MRTVKSHNIAIMVQELSVVGLAGNDAIRLARLIATGNFQHMHNACRETINGGQDFLFRFAGSDLVVFGPKGYAIINHIGGWIDMAYSYAYRGTSFAEQTYLYRDMPLDLQGLQDDEQPAKHNFQGPQNRLFQTRSRRCGRFPTLLGLRFYRNNSPSDRSLRLC